MTDTHTRPATRPTTGRTVDGTTVVTLRGEIDLLTATPLAARLDALTAGPRPDLVLDLRPVEFIDCAGLGVLCRVRNRVLERGGRLRLVTDSGMFRRVLRAAGLANVFELCPTVPAGPLSATPPLPPL
ncbi:STAS domain-containing protein [Streptomyces sp. NPDC026672]|uniref:STAS domain-containing protein n=1 Tax=unclassified Streptomyces TaxID=2593676 RepID=UPI00340FEBB7